MMEPAGGGGTSPPVAVGSGMRAARRLAANAALHARVHAHVERHACALLHILADDAVAAVAADEAHAAERAARPRAAEAAADAEAAAAAASAIVNEALCADAADFAASAAGVCTAVYQGTSYPCVVLPPAEWPGPPPAAKGAVCVAWLRRPVSSADTFTWEVRGIQSFNPTST